MAHFQLESMSILRCDISYYYENRVSERVQKVDTTFNFVIIKRLFKTFKSILTAMLKNFEL